MVILASSICTKTGKALVSRQFVEMPRTHIEGLLASFPKLMVPGQQHTTVETDTIRYLYQPIGEEMYAVLITTRQSNIVQDMDTLYLVARAVSVICDVSDQQDVVMHGFDIILAFDEIISQGYRDNVDLTKLRIILKMESHGERIHDTIERNKVRSAKQELKRQAKMFAQQRRETAKRGMPGLSGMGVGPGGTILGRGNMGSSYEPLLSREPEPARPFSSAAPGRSDSPSVSSSTRGMRMGRKPKGADIMGAMRNEIDLTQSLVENMSIADTDTAAAPGLSSAMSRTAQPPVIPQIDMKGVHVQIEERIAAVVNRDGGLEQMEVKGDLSLVISDAAYASIQLRVAMSNQHNAQVKTHPKVDKRRFHTDSVIALKDATSSFPLSQPIGVLKWRIVSSNEDAIPLAVNCWPSPSADGSVEVNIEYELTNAKLELEDVSISIPIPAGVQPTVSDVDGVYEFDRAHSVLVWQIPTIDASNPSGSLDFSVPGQDAGQFFPVVVSFGCQKPYFDIEVTSITSADNQPVDFSQIIALIPEQYAVI